MLITKKIIFLFLVKILYKELMVQQFMQKKCIQLILIFCFVLSLYYKGDYRYLFANGTEIHKFKVKDSEIVLYLQCLGNISKNFSVDNMRKTGLNLYIYDFSVDYDAIAVDDILEIHKYLMKKNGIV